MARGSAILRLLLRFLLREILTQRIEQRCDWCRTNQHHTGEWLLTAADAMLNGAARVQNAREVSARGLEEIEAGSARAAAPILRRSTIGADPRGALSSDYLDGGCKVVLNRYWLWNSVRSPARLPCTGCRRADKGLCHFQAREATSPMIFSNCSWLMSPV